MTESQRSELTADQIAELRSELERELARLDRNMDASRDAARPVKLDQTSVGRLSRMDELQNQQMSKDLHSRNQARHAHIVDALERMDARTYGVCARCSQAIPYGRLLVFPEARMCATCGAREG